jgi:hypothetical protein
VCYEICTHTTGPGEFPAVTGLSFHVDQWKPFRDLRKWKCISRFDLCRNADFDPVPRPNTFWCQHESLVSILERYPGDGCASGRIVFDIYHFSGNYLVFAILVGKLLLVAM